MAKKSIKPIEAPKLNVDSITTTNLLKSLKLALNEYKRILLVFSNKATGLYWLTETRAYLRDDYETFLVRADLNELHIDGIYKIKFGCTYAISEGVIKESDYDIKINLT